jgi:hypothetical protein
MAAVKWLRPKSLSGLMLLGLTLIAVPLLIAILTAAIQMRELTLASQELVRQSVQNTRLTHDLENLIASNERTTRLFQVLGDRRLLEVLRRNSNEITAASQALRGPAPSSMICRRNAAPMRLPRAIRRPWSTISRACRIWPW